MGYVDKMTDRLNDTDLRLLRHSINQGEKGAQDTEKDDESRLTNQEFSLKENKLPARPTD
jgi:hypothetical protein